MGKPPTQPQYQDEGGGRHLSCDNRGGQSESKAGRQHLKSESEQRSREVRGQD